MTNFAKLKEPFPADDIEWRVQQAGEKNGKAWAMVLAYVTNRAIMERLDAVVGPHNWQNQFSALPDGGITCGIGIRVEDEWIWKWDGADKTQIEATKGGLSGAMKRAGVQWGIGRYLYNLDATFATVHQGGTHYQPGKQGKYQAFKWDAPVLPGWALPSKFVDLEALEMSVMAKNTLDDLTAYYKTRASEIQGADNEKQATALFAKRKAELLAHQQDNPISAAQRKAIMAHFKGVDRDARLAELSSFFQREITSANDLSKDEASEIIDALTHKQEQEQAAA